ncbi:type II toxin-antitoxin system RelE/ParE family toxin, partial [Acinetobacter indicus]|uniref:type II toxin-antitoxin system RelE/ParE family toxin n=1 Tax=Acinetobacter indicus TaxID=756892 RepID=UPI001D197613
SKQRKATSNGCLTSTFNFGYLWEDYHMKELRVQHRGRPLRAFFAFDPLRQAIVLCIADKGGKKRFYKDMLDIADEQYQLHLTTLGDKSNG